MDEFHVMKSNSTSSLTKDCHCFIIGDVSVGKASLLHQYFRFFLFSFFFSFCLPFFRPENLILKQKEFTREKNHSRI